MAVSEAVVSRKSFIGNPVCVGVGGFAITTTTLGLYSIGMFDPKGMTIVLILAAAYGGLIQWIAGFFALAKGETFAASFMTAYGAFWWAYVALLVYGVPNMGDAAGPAVAIFLIMWTITTIIFTIAALNTNKMVLATFIEFVCTLIALDVGAAGDIHLASLIGGYLVILLGLMGWYIVLAEMVNDMSGHSVIPLGAFRRGPLLAQTAVEPERDFAASP